MADRPKGRSPHNLTKQQSAFVEHYTRHLNAAAAYRHAYPTSKKWTNKRVASEASKALQHQGISAIIQARAEKVAAIAEKEFDLSARLILQELAAIALAKPGDFYQWGKRNVTRHKKDGTAYEVEVDFVDLTPSDKLTEVQKKAVVAAELTTNKFGEVIPVLKLADRTKALIKLGEHFQLFNGKIDIVHQGTVSHQAVEPDAVKQSNDPRDALKLFDAFRRQQQLPPGSFGKAN